MPINFPSSPSNNQLFVTEGKAMRYNATKNRWKAVSTLSSSQITDLENRTIGVSSMSISGNTLVIQKDDSSYANVSLAPFAGNKLTTYANASILPLSDLVSGTQVYVEDTDSLYITDGSGWYKIATVNLSPSLTLGVSSISLGPGGSVDVNYTVNEPEDTPYTVSASSTSNATITVYQANNTITFNSPVQNTTETITITATDGINSVGDTLTMTIALLISNSKYTTLLATAVDTSNNSTITDSSSNARSVTIAGDPIIGTFSPYRHGGYSVRFGDESYDRILIQDSINIGQDFTMEAWIYPDIVSAQQGQIISQDDAFADGMVFELRVYSNGELRFPFWQNSSRSSVVSVVVPNVITSGKWQHIVVRRISSTNELRIFVDGVSVYSNSSYSFYSTGRNFAIGNLINRTDPGYTDYFYEDEFIGYIADVRVSNTSSIYSGTSFTPPTERLTASSSTLLLACNDHSISRYKTSSSTSSNVKIGQTSGNVGLTAVSSFSPYDTSNYDETNHGGSIYFDGVGDYLDMGSAIIPATGDFTIQGWIYPKQQSGALQGGLVGQTSNTGHSGRLTLYYEHNNLNNNIPQVVAFVGGSTISANVTSAHQWIHVAWTRDSGTDRLFIDGILKGTASLPSIEQTNTQIGQHNYPDREFTGFISDLRIDTSALYTSNFTPPTSPLSSTGAALHIKGTDADIIDKAQVSNIIVRGNVTGSTAQAKFAGTKSMYFDGTDDAISLPDNSVDYQFGDHDFTVEAWIYTNSSTSQAIVNLSHNNSYGTRIQLSSNLRLQVLFDDGSNNHTLTYEATTGAVSINTWTHVAIVRNGNNIMMFKDGTQVGTTQTISFSLRKSPRHDIGGIFYNNSWRQVFSGYMQDLRITKGLARYTSNFTPPTSSLEG